MGLAEGHRAMSCRSSAGNPRRPGGGWLSRRNGRPERGKLSPRSRLVTAPVGLSPAARLAAPICAPSVLSLHHPRSSIRLRGAGADLPDYHGDHAPGLSPRGHASSRAASAAEFDAPGDPSAAPQSMVRGGGHGNALAMEPSERQALRVHAADRDARGLSGTDLAAVENSAAKDLGLQGSHVEGYAPPSNDPRMNVIKRGARSGRDRGQYPARP